MAKKWFQNGYRRMLVDMHIPDWDSEFLSKFDPAEMVRLYKTAGLTSVMFYVQSHVGLCNWPTKSGKMHACLTGRDIVGQTVNLLNEANIASCAYYSVIFNNWAWLEHPEWRMEQENPSPELCIDGRYGFVCPNNPDYRQFCREQIGELLAAYSLDGLFYDMTFWPGVCTCRHCRELYRSQYGKEIPAKVDWFDENWCSFQRAREKWMLDFAEMLNETARGLDPEITVYHNFASALSNWMSVGFCNSVANDFLGADFYGDPIEQLTVSKLMCNLTENKPVEFMTSRCLNLMEHESNKGFDLMRTQALATVLFGGAMLFIDAINPDGTANEPVYEMVGRAFYEMGQYEPFLGGEAIEDVAVYFSGDSKMDFAENGCELKTALWQRNYPHLKAVRGVCGALQQAHIPFGVITRKQLDSLCDYKVLVLPNVLRMDKSEVEAVRKYVRNGGKLYASRYTSLTEISGSRHEDFMLADVFGCSFAADDLGDVAYLKPVSDEINEAILPQKYLGHMSLADTPNAEAGMLCLADNPAGETLATLTKPYDSQWGSILTQNWASIHSSPPWRDTETPAIVRNKFGQGEVIYSAADIECMDCDADRRVLIELMAQLLGENQSAAADAHKCVWMSLHDQHENNRIIFGLLNYQTQLPAIAIADIPIRIKPPKDKVFKALKSLPDGDSIPFVLDSDGQLAATIKKLETLIMLAAEYE